MHRYDGEASWTRSQFRSSFIPIIHYMRFLWAKGTEWLGAGAQTANEKK